MIYKEFKTHLDMQERNYWHEELVCNNYNISKTARSVGTNPMFVLRRLRKYKLDIVRAIKER